ncbi:MAG TPA: TlyA family RNA methyltransferase [Acidimicrobiales bacterium]|nr:TlyA family RNA methyltransferase [Acidimicrobiales bacterium]
MKGLLTVVRRRLDVELVRRGLAESRESSRSLIAAGLVTVANVVATKPARRTAPDEPIELLGPPPRFVSRGGIKLDAALTAFALEVEGWRAIDVGASTGGFTDCLLQRGVVAVTSIDVGYGQLHERLRADPRVSVRERTHIRDCRAENLGGPVPLVVVDVSFISLSSVLDAVLGLVEPEGRIIALVKPQFEAGRADADRGRGVIRDAAVWRRVLVALRSDVEARGAAMMGLMISPITGAQGNVEFFALIERSAGPSRPPVDDEAIDAVIDEARQREQPR